MKRLPILLVFVALLGCDECEHEIRKLVSNRGDRKMPSSTTGTTSGPAEKEPNDDPTSASTLVLGKELRDITGAIATPDDTDWFAFTTTEEAAFTLEVVPETALDISVHVEVEGAAALSYDEGRRGEAERIAALKLSSRPQRIVIRPQSGSSGQYTLRFRRQLGDEGIEAEPNDEAAVATGFTLPGELQGTYDRPDDRDVYRLMGDPGKPYDIEIGNLPGGRHIARIFDDEKLSEPALTVQVVDLPVHIPNLALDAKKPRFLVMTPLGAPPTDQVYRLRAQPHPALQTALELEPNDVVAQPLVFDQAQGDGRKAVVSGYIHAADDRDKFELTPPNLPERTTPIPHPRDEPDYLARFRTKPKPRVPIWATLSWASDQASYGMTWTAADDTTIEFRQTTPKLEVRACGLNLETGPAVLAVRAERLDAAPKIGVPQYTLEVVETSAGDSFEAEPNDESDAADVLEGARRGTFAVVDDVDVFAFAVNSGQPDELQKVKIEAEGNGVDLLLKITDDGGGLIATVDNAQLGGRESVEVDLPAGLYFAELRWNGGDLCVPYSIELTTR